MHVPSTLKRYLADMMFIAFRLLLALFSLVSGISPDDDSSTEPFGLWVFLAVLGISLVITCIGACANCLRKNARKHPQDATSIRGTGLTSDSHLYEGTEGYPGLQTSHNSCSPYYSMQEGTRRDRQQPESYMQPQHVYKHEYFDIDQPYYENERFETNLYEPVNGVSDARSSGAQGHKR